ncbi:MAG: fructosamine kinase family protein [Solirubrobacterales bacterium]|nr:fructosamine kinase family protein [Solirubrobacterales bacterium]MCB8971075.1 fructosamine kinase family protein [Thermoleophilales bacterium]MCO5326030.1 fructosamine kinase family protein [Solirubrobacterales bacterium]
MNEEALLAAAARALGRRIEGSGRVSGGDINEAWALELEGGGRAFLKSRAGAPEDEFGAEAAGLRWLGKPGGLPVPEVLAVIDDDGERGLVLEWVERGALGPGGEEDLGRGLATIHAAGADAFDALPPDSPRTELRFGGGEVESYGGDTWAEVYAARLERLARAALGRGAITERCAGLVAEVCARMGALAGPDERPARIHGDLWSGNVLAGADGRPWLIDPKAHGAHREMDLAMLDLFGSVSARTLRAYDEVWPLDDGRAERVGLWQLQPLLVHAILFGGSYGAAVERVAAGYA